MSVGDGESDFVWVSEKTTIALTNPQFIIKVGERYYLTLAVWEYDFEKADGEDQRHGCKHVARIFAGTSPKLEAVKPPEEGDPLWEEMIGTRTKPSSKS
jgi:hypothetical protein